MKILSTLAIVSMTLSSVALADGGCKPAGCHPDRNVASCRPTVKKVDIKATCYKIETKTICIPPTRFPWDPSPCDSLCGEKCGKNSQDRQLPAGTVRQEADQVVEEDRRSLCL